MAVDPQGPGLPDKKVNEAAAWDQAALSAARKRAEQEPRPKTDPYQLGDFDADDAREAQEKAGEAGHHSTLSTNSKSPDSPQAQEEKERRERAELAAKLESEAFKAQAYELISQLNQVIEETQVQKDQSIKVVEKDFNEIVMVLDAEVTRLITATGGWENKIEATRVDAGPGLIFKDGDRIFTLDDQGQQQDITDVGDLQVLYMDMQANPKKQFADYNNPLAVQLDKAMKDLAKAQDDLQKSQAMKQYNAAAKTQVGAINEKSRLEEMTKEDCSLKTQQDLEGARRVIESSSGTETTRQTTQKTDQTVSTPAPAPAYDANEARLFAAARAQIEGSTITQANLDQVLLDAQSYASPAHIAKLQAELQRLDIKILQKPSDPTLTSQTFKIDPSYGVSDYNRSPFNLDQPLQQYKWQDLSKNDITASKAASLDNAGMDGQNLLKDLYQQKADGVSVVLAAAPTMAGAPRPHDPDPALDEQLKYKPNLGMGNN